MAEVFLENPHGRKKRSKARKGRRNAPTLMLIGNPRKASAGGKHMAKRKKGNGKKRQPAALRAYWAKKRLGKLTVGKRAHKSTKGHKAKRRSSGQRAITLHRRKSAYRKHGRSFTRVRGSVWSNPMGGLVRLPSTQELMAVGIGALALPAVSKLVKSLPLPDLMKTGWGGIATELLIGSAASVMARRFVSASAGDVIFVLTLAKGVQASVRQLAPTVADSIGLADGDDLSYYDPANPSLGYYDPSNTGVSDMTDGGLPEMV